MTTKADLPAQPEIVRAWMRESRTLERQATATLFSGRTDIIATAEEVMGLLTAAFVMPDDVRTAYERWAGEYNAVVARINAERQARINAREVAKVRASACPSCFATHAGEC